MSELKSVGFEEFKKHLSDKETQVIDIRDMKSYSEGHINGSVNIPLTQSFSNFARQLLDNNSPVVLIGQKESVSQAYDQLSDLDHNGPFYYYEGGVEDWKKNGEKLDFMKDISADDLVQRINKGNVEGVVIDIRNENET